MDWVAGKRCDLRYKRLNPSSFEFHIRIPLRDRTRQKEPIASKLALRALMSSAVPQQTQRSVIAL
jgi:hypothetical protein